MKTKQIIVPVSMLLLVMFANMTSASEKAYTFGVLNQRNVLITAEYWNPILDYVTKKSGVTLQLKIGKTVQETDQMTERGEFDFVYSNHIFIPRIAKTGYRVIARSAEESIMGQIVVLEDASIRQMEEIAGKEVAFPSETAFVGYAVTMDALMRKGLQVKVVYAGNHDGAMGQLKAGRVAAASVNSQLIKEFSAKEQFKYRVLWSSAKFANLPIAVNRRVDKKKITTVRDAFVGMASDPEGVKILAASAAVLKQKPPFGFVAADERDYESLKTFYAKTVLKGF